MRARAWMLFGGLLVGCMNEGAQRAPTEPDEPASPPCALMGPTAWTVSEGGRLVATLQGSQPGSHFAISSAPAGWRVELDGSTGALRAKAPYGGTPSTVTPSVTVECPDGTSAEGTLAWHVRALRWGTPLTWAGGVEGPAAREHTLLWVDPLAPDRLFLFGGYVFEPQQYTPAFDLWSLDLETGAWQERTQGTPVPERAGGRAAQVPGSQTLWVYSGDTPSGAMTRDVFQLGYGAEPAAWTQLSPTPGGEPKGGILGSFIYDAVRQRFITACGFASTGPHCEVHQLAGETWEKLAPPGSAPTGRYGFAYAYDAETERLVLFSGGQAPKSGQDLVNPAADTWALELGSTPERWVRLSPGQSDVPGRRNACWALDPVGHRLFVWGGTPDAQTSTQGLYALDLDRGHEGWTRLELPDAPPSRSSCTGVYDAARGRILFGFGNDSTEEYVDLQPLEL